MLRNFILILFLLAATGITHARTLSTYWTQRATLFEVLPVSPNDIIFLGNSITDGGEWCELIGEPNVKNRGISGDIVEGVRKRLDAVTKGKPKKIFLLIGINDIADGIDVDTIADNYERLVDEILTASPDTRLYLQSVMPVDTRDTRFKGLIGRDGRIPVLNEKIRDIAKRKNLTYIDLWPALADSDGRLDRRYSNDGLHLLGDGYLQWVSIVKPFINEE